MSISDGKLQDWLGHDITVGSKIVYPGYRSSSLWMTFAEVKDIQININPFDHVRSWVLIVEPLRSTFHSGHVDKRQVRLTAISRVTVIEGC